MRPLFVNYLPYGGHNDMSFIESYPVSHKDSLNAQYGIAYVFDTKLEAQAFAAVKRKNLRDSSRVSAPAEGHNRHAPEQKRWRVVIRGVPA